MALFELTTEALRVVKPTTFTDQGVKERTDLQRLLRQQVGIIAEGTMVITEEFGDWEESRRRIDLLGLDRDANLVVIELKRTEEGGHLELQAVRYAAMVSTMTFDQVVEAHDAFRARHGIEGEARAAILEFLGWLEPNETAFAQDVRIVLVSGNFSKEITTAVMWLNQKGLDIRCVRLLVHSLDSRILVDVQQIIPLKEAADYQIKVRAKQQQERVSTQTGRDLTKYDVSINGVPYERLAKRHAVFRAVKGLCDLGITPSQITAASPFGPERLWFWVDGTLDAAGFLESAKESLREFDEGRWFYDDGQLIHAEGKTWAFKNQWGPSTTKMLDALVSAFSPKGLSYIARQGSIG